MSGFREFLLQELQGGGYGYQPRMTRITGIYNLPDLFAATQLGQPPIGGYGGFGHAAQWQATQRQYNEKYPMPGLNITYAQMKAQLTDLAQRVQAIAGVIASGGTRPGDEDMTARLRYAHFEGQRAPSGPPPAVGGRATDPGVDKNSIRNVDGRVFYGEVSGRGGAIGFKIGETLGIITPTKEIHPKTGNVEGSHFDIDVNRLKSEMEKSMELFRKFERSLQAQTFIGSKADKFTQKLTQSQGGMATVRQNWNPLSQAAMRKN